MKKILVTIIFFSFSSFLYGQSEKEKTYFKKETKLGMTNEVGNKLRVKNLLLKTLMPIQTIGGTGYPDANMNFAPGSNLRAAGDVNKDGFQDFYYSVLTGNESTESLTDRVLKTKLFYGSAAGLSDDNSTIFIDSTSIFKEGLELIGDLTGDGITEGYILTDSTLTFYSDASGGEMNEIESILILSANFSDYEVKSFGDFNADGFDDAIVFGKVTRDIQAAKFYLVYGAESLSEFKVSTINNNKVFDSSGRYEQLMYTDFEADGIPEIVQITGLINEDIGRIYIYQLDENDELSIIDSLDFPKVNSRTLDFRQGTYATIDINNDGFKEFIAALRNVVFIFTKDESSPEHILDVINYNPYEGNYFSIIGDYNDDGFTDLLVSGGTNRIIIGNNSMSLGYSLLPDFGTGRTSPIQPLRNDSKIAGDLSGDGIDDFILEFTTGNKAGFRTFFGNSTASFSDTSTISYRSPFFPVEYSEHTVNLGDLNKDNIDDYGIVYTGALNYEESAPRLEIFYGGDVSKSVPDLVINHPNKHPLSDPTSGDFNGDGFSDIAINYEDETSGINIYFGEVNMDNSSDYELTFSQMFPENLGRSSSDNAFEAPVNAGDINNDGFDDLVFSSPQVSKKTYLLYGGEAFSDTPDLEIDYYATNFVPMKDFNGDGLNDLALSFYGDNTILIYSGFDENSGGSFSQEPLITIFEPSNDGEKVLNFFGVHMDSGDYNGDGFSDIIAAPIQHYSAIDRNIGIESQYIYLGGANADSLADHKFGLKTNLFVGVGNTVQTSELLTNNLGELTTVPDQNGDGADEILIGTTPANFGSDSKTNAVIYFGASDITQINEEGDIVFEAPNKLLGMGADNNSVITQTAHTTVGDFDGDKKNDFIFSQGRDFNFIKSPVYIYSSTEFSVGIDDELGKVKDFRLDQNYPNPFNPSTTINYTIPTTSRVKLTIYDVLGRVVSTLVDKQQTSGTHEVNLNASAWASGMYFYRIEAGNFIKTRRLTLIK